MRQLVLVTGLLLSGSALGGCTGTSPAAETDRPSARLSWEQPAWVDGAVLYEVFVPDFTEEGTFRAIIPRLPELKALGVTTLWLMPIHPIGEEGRKGVLGSPYAIRDYYDVNPAYGTKEDFRALVDAVHDEGMHLLLDFVANHTAPDHPWTVEHPEWYTRGPAGGLVTPISPEGEPTDWTDVADLDYSNPELRAEMIDVMRYWVEEFDVDGYRCDVAGWVPLSFWDEAIAALREIKPVLMLAENEDPAIHLVGFDLTYAWPEYAALKAVWEGAPVSGLIALVQEVEEALPPGAGRLRFTTNHDETAWDAPPPVLFDGQEGAQAAFVLSASLPGAPLVYNGQELGMEEPVPFFQATPYDWTVRPEVRAFYRRVLNAYHESPALRTGTTTFPLPDAEDVILVEREAEGERVIAAVNVRDREVRVPAPPALQGTTWTDLLSGETVVVGDELALAPYEYRLLQAR